MDHDPGRGIFRIYKSDNLRDIACKYTWVFEEFLDLFELCVDGDPNNKKWVLSLAGMAISSVNSTGRILSSNRNT